MLIVVGGQEEGGEESLKAATMKIVVSYCATTRRVMTILMAELK
jgi:hypothetical protein